LQTILLTPYPCGTNPCINPTFGPAQSGYYWSATTLSGYPGEAWYVAFDAGSVATLSKSEFSFSVRAVRGGS
jgi:hypothetical protein